MVSPDSLKQGGGDSSDKGDAENLHTRLAPKNGSVPCGRGGSDHMDKVGPCPCITLDYT